MYRISGKKSNNAIFPDRLILGQEGLSSKFLNNAGLETCFSLSPCLFTYVHSAVVHVKLQCFDTHLSCFSDGSVVLEKGEQGLGFTITGDGAGIFVAEKEGCKILSVSTATHIGYLEESTACMKMCYVSVISTVSRSSSQQTSMLSKGTSTPGVLTRWRICT
jgi:hypothetical protein